MNEQRTVALIKPDAYKRGLIGIIITRMESAGFKIDEIEGAEWGDEMARCFYGKQHEGRPYFEELVRFTCSGPMVALCLRKPNAIADWRALMGPSKRSDQRRGQIRYDYLALMSRVMENLVHGSDSPEMFEYEYQLVFGEVD